VNCKILSKTSNQYFDAYVLSESSLFVYPYKMMLKTCGTTTLLKCLKPLLSLTKSLMLEPTFVWYSRTRLLFPEKQLNPHQSFEEEVEWLDRFFEGTGFVFGPVKDDHWYMYICDLSQNEKQQVKVPDQTLEIMMFELDQTKMKQFWKKDGVDAQKVTVSSGISKLLPGSVIDPYQFDPCGYSMNGLLEDSYWTIHITPEDHCSYVSFETNVSAKQLGNRTHADLVRDVINTFKPGRFVVTFFADDGSIKNPKAFAEMQREISMCKTKFNNYFRFGKADYSLSMGVYQSYDNINKKQKQKKQKLGLAEKLEERVVTNALFNGIPALVAD
jgi:S-adenosylmethionine decarboxylase